jgi:hypothetical protein
VIRRYTLFGHASAAVLAVLVGCGGAKPTELPLTGAVATTVSPKQFSVERGSQRSFGAESRDSNGTLVSATYSWGAAGGTISAAGVFTAGPNAGPSVVWVSGSEGGADTAKGTITDPPPGPGPDTVFAEGFESGSLAMWQDRGLPANQQVVTDGSQAHSGSRFLEITFPNGTDGGWLTRFFMPGYDSLYVRMWVRFDSNWQGAKLFSLRGSRTDDQWSGFGNAGTCPSGSDFFSSNLTNGPADGTLFYVYYLGMAREPDGVTCWGRNTSPSTTYYPPTTLSLGQWHQVELWIRLNTPGQIDAMQRFWLDGTLRGAWGALSFRDSSILALNSFQINASTSGATQTQHLDVDDILILTSTPSP